MEKVVLVGEHHIRRLDQLERGVASGSATAVLLVDDDKPRIGGGSLRKNVARAVCRTVVDAKTCPFAQTLSLHGVQQCGEVPLSVVHGYDEGDGFHGAYSAGQTIRAPKYPLSLDG